MKQYAEFLARSRLSPATIKTYLSSVRLFLQYLEGVGVAPAGVTFEVMEGYLHSLERNRYANATVRLRLIAAIDYLEFAHAFTLSRSAWRVLIPRRAMPTASKVLTEDEVRLIKLKLIEKDAHIRIHFYLMLSAGLRVGEVIHLRSRDFEEIGGKLLLHLSSTKGNVARTTICADPEAHSFIRQYVAADGRFDMVGVRTIQGHAQKMANDLGIDFSCHSLRHYFATRLLSQNVKIETIQALLGHRSLATTRIYAHTTLDDILKIGG